MIGLSLELFAFVEPCTGSGIAGHAPIAAGTEADTPDFWGIRCAGAFELLGEEATDKDSKPMFDGGCIIGTGIRSVPVKSCAGKHEEFCGGEAMANHVI